jgi:hypothetical protein
MNYVPQTKWIGAAPMPEVAEPVKPVTPRRTRKLTAQRVTVLLKAKPWLTAGQIAIALESEVTADSSAVRTLRRMYQVGIVERKRSAAGEFIFGPKA